MSSLQRVEFIGMEFMDDGQPAPVSLEALRIQHSNHAIGDL